MRRGWGLLLGLLILGTADATQEAGSTRYWVDPAERAVRQFRRTHPHLDSALQVGEKLTFSVRYGPIRAGEATMAISGVEVVDGDSCYHIVTTARSSSFFSTFFHVHDQVESYASLRNLLPRRFEKHLNEGNYHDSQVVEIRPEQRLARYDDGSIVELLPDTHDILSAFYSVRARRLRVGDEVLFDCHMNRKNYPLKTSVHRRERVSVPAGEFECLVVEPVLRTPGLFKQEGSLTIWLTDDERRVPVQMRSSLPIGSISVVLTEVAGRSDWER